MSNQTPPTREALGVTQKVAVLRVAMATGLSAAIVFVLCWVGIFIPFSSPTHAYISLFTSAAPASLQALGEGSCWALLFGLVAGAVFAFVYNLCGRLGRR